uniref:Uncharacterized protein n=1 Tax=Arundo donax TaxID=35708 RepID=A0A0A8Z813_ARUDO
MFLAVGSKPTCTYFNDVMVLLSFDNIVL